MYLRKFLCTFISMATCLTLFSGCYRTPVEGEYSVIPATNNPAVVGTRGSDNFLPSGNF